MNFSNIEHTNSNNKMYLKIISTIFFTLAKFFTTCADPLINFTSYKTSQPRNCTNALNTSEKLITEKDGANVKQEHTISTVLLTKK